MSINGISGKGSFQRRLEMLEQAINVRQRRTFMGTQTVSDDPDIQARSDADLAKLKEELGVTDRDVCVLVKHFYYLKDHDGSYYATDGGYLPPSLNLCGWHARYDLIFPGDPA
jgi:hypothetical protein